MWWETAFWAGLLSITSLYPHCFPTLTGRGVLWITDTAPLVCHSLYLSGNKRQLWASWTKNRIKKQRCTFWILSFLTKARSLKRRPVTRADLGSYLPKGMLEQGGMANKANIINLQFKLFAAHIWLGSQNCCQDDIWKPWRAEIEVITIFKKHTRRIFLQMQIYFNLWVFKGLYIVFELLYLEYHQLWKIKNPLITSLRSSQL